MNWLQHAEGVDTPVHGLTGLSHHVVARERRVDDKRLLSVDAQNELHTTFEIQAEQEPSFGHESWER
jgi:hypothetical protein